MNICLNRFLKIVQFENHYHHQQALVAKPLLTKKHYRTVSLKSIIIFQWANTTPLSIKTRITRLRTEYCIIRSLE